MRELILHRVKAGVIEWLILCGADYEPIAPGADGIIRSETFPGLWLDPAAMVAGDLALVAAVLQQGTASPEHAAFVARLAHATRGT